MKTAFLCCNQDDYEGENSVAIFLNREDAEFYKDKRIQDYKEKFGYGGYLSIVELPLNASFKEIEKFDCFNKKYF